MKKTSTEPTKATVGAMHPKPATSNKSFVVVIALVLAVIIIGIGVLTWHSHKKSTAGDSCSSAILKQAATNFDLTKIAQLQIVTKQIRAIPNYQQDPNCMYVALTTDINSGDALTARSDLNQLQKVYNAQKGFSQSLGFTKSISLLQSDVTFMENGVKQEESQTQTFNNP